MNRPIHRIHALCTVLACAACSSDPVPPVGDSGADAGSPDLTSHSGVTTAAEGSAPTSERSSPTSSSSVTQPSFAETTSDEKGSSSGDTLGVRESSETLAASLDATTSSSAPTESSDVSRTTPSSPWSSTAGETSVFDSTSDVGGSTNSIFESTSLDPSGFTPGISGGETTLLDAGGYRADAGDRTDAGDRADAGDAALTETEPPVLQQSTHGAWCANPIPVVVVEGVGSILNNPSDDLGQANAELVERLTICPGESTQYCDATSEGELVAVMMRECQLPSQACPADGLPASAGCSQTTMEDIYSSEIEVSTYIAFGCCFEGQLDQVYTESCSAELEGARCPAVDPCLDQGYCVAGECVAGPPLDCNDEFFCNGEEYCLESVGCQPGPVPQFDDDRCTNDLCVEGTQSVTHEDVLECPLDVCSNDRIVNAGYLSFASSDTPNLNQIAITPDGGAWETSLSIPCGETVAPDFSGSQWACGLTDAGEVFVLNNRHVAVSQPVSSGCSYEMTYEETKLAGSNGYQGFVFGCCLGAEPFEPSSPNVEPLPPGP